MLSHNHIIYFTDSALDATFYFDNMEHWLDASSLLPLVGAAIMPFITLLDDDDDDCDDHDVDEFDKDSDDDDE